jgi:hypothetical protein
MEQSIFFLILYQQEFYLKPSNIINRFIHYILVQHCNSRIIKFHIIIMKGYFYLIFQDKLYLRNPNFIITNIISQIKRLIIIHILKSYFRSTLCTYI